jgi:hypothetical protein
MLDPKRPIGPNMKKLIIHKMSVDAVPPGGGLAAAIESFEPAKMRENWRNAYLWAVNAILQIKSAPDNTFGEDEETIAGEVLKKIDERKAAQALARRQK